MANGKLSIIVPILMITVGAGWLLTVQGIGPEINWVWTLGLAIVGICTFLSAGFDKFSFVVGSFFVLASGLSVLRQTGRLAVDVEIPVVVIALGILVLIARSPAIPAPDWVEIEHSRDGADKSRGERTN